MPDIPSTYVVKYLFKQECLALSSSIVPGILPSLGLILAPVSLILFGNVRDERIVRVGIGQKGRNGEEDLGDCEGGGPGIL